MAKRVELVCLWLMGMALGVAYATDPNQLQDFCVAVNTPYDGLFVNGLFCKNPKDAKPEDFLYRGLKVDPEYIIEKLGINFTLVTAANLPGLNTLGISLGRVDYAPCGLVPPHTHPRATEIITVLEGTLLAGFVTSDLPNNYGNKLFSQLLKAGDVFVFPQGLIHFQYNVGPIPAVAINAYSSQNPGILTIADAVFGSKPPISVDVLSKAFHADASVIQKLESQCLNNGIN